MISKTDIAALMQAGFEWVDELARTRGGLVVRRAPPKYPVGGGTPIFGKGGLTNRAGLSAVGSWESADGVAKPVTIVVSAPMGSFQTTAGAMCKVRFGDQRGSTFLWLPVPGITTVVASSVSVQAMACGTPYAIVSLSGIAGPWEPRNMAPSVTAFQVPITCLIRDGSPADDPQLTLLAFNQVAPANLGQLVPIVGPVFIDSLELNNESGTPVPVIWGESADGAAIPTSQIGSVIVPANASVGIARQMLGPVAAGFVVVPVASLTAAAGGVPTFNANAGSITMNISGFYLPT
jgi:hypothetical protein